MQQNIVMLCSLDTKAREAQYLKDCIEEQGAKTFLVDIGYGKPAKMAATITADEVATAAGSDIESIRAVQDTGLASQLIMQGAIIKAQDRLEAAGRAGVPYSPSRSDGDPPTMPGHLRLTQRGQLHVEPLSGTASDAMSGRGVY